jgi:oxygen-independent coproporphyrinogen-3 oxidase
MNDAGLYPKLLMALPENSTISLYLHVPFCQKMCWYCGCHTKITQRYAPVEDYAHLMMREIEMVANIISKNHQVNNIHFGGGSPGMLRSQDFEMIMERINKNFNVSKNAEIAIEIDPRGITEGRVASYARAGVNRISLGVQDFDDTVLEAVNRQQPFELSEIAVNLFRKLTHPLIKGFESGVTPDRLRSSLLLHATNIS